MQYQTVSKSKFKAKALEYFRLVELTKQSIIVSHNNKPVIKVSSIKPTGDVDLKALFGSVLKYDNPTDPVGLEDWEALK